MRKLFFLFYSISLSIELFLKPFAVSLWVIFYISDVCLSLDRKHHLFVRFISNNNRICI